jgi:hypothetical protein
MNPAQTYIVSCNGEQTGPYDRSQIVGLIRRGRLSPHEFFLDPVTKKWLPLTVLMDSRPHKAQDMSSLETRHVVYGILNLTLGAAFIVVGVWMCTEIESATIGHPDWTPPFLWLFYAGTIIPVAGILPIIGGIKLFMGNTISIGSTAEVSLLTWKIVTPFVFLALGADALQNKGDSFPPFLIHMLVCCLVLWGYNWLMMGLFSSERNY